MYKKRSMESSETPVLYRGRTVPKGESSVAGRVRIQVAQTIYCKQK